MHVVRTEAELITVTVSVKCKYETGSNSIE